MNVLFLNPPFKGSFNREVRFQAVSPQKALHPPIMLAYAAAVCEKEGHRVDLIDSPALDMGMEETLQHAVKFAPDLIVLLTSTASVKSDGEFAKKLKKATGAKTVAVGVHASSMPEDTLKKGFDIIARGEYENTIKDLAAGKKLPKILGITFKEKGKVKSNKPRPLMHNLDELPFPARKFLPNEKYYSAIYKNPFTFVLAGRGCPFQCIFCSLPQVMSGRGYRMRSPQNVVAELEQIKKDFPQLKSILFNDDTLNVNKKHLKELCDLIIEKNISLPWGCYSRVDTIDEESAIIMKKAGCYLVKIGFESGNDQILKNMKKGTTTGQARTAVKIFKKAGIQIHGTFVFGMPGETKETIQQTIDFAKELNVDFVQFSVAQPYPGTEFYNYLKKNKLLEFKEWEDYLDDEGCITPIFEYPNLKKEEMEAMLKKAYKNYYFRPAYILKAIGQRLTNAELRKTSFRSGKNLIKYVFEK
ncbi:MAG: radical SAM protein [Candidatus Diapherotrites archaeon]|nr:radical SAM protein [Candidatus Diapherotrites archaeon]